MQNIVLVGFMGTGKTSVAKKLASRMHMKYVSTDDLIEKKEGIPISEIFSKKGEDYFRKIETKIVKELSLLEGLVIDSGGGIVTNQENINDFKKNGIVVCLWAEPETILKRTGKETHRPLLNVEDPFNKIKGLLKARKPFYETADFHIHTGDLTAEEVACEVERIANERKKH